VGSGGIIKQILYICICFILPLTKFKQNLFINYSWR